jgi:hypothetical protein
MLKYTMRAAVLPSMKFKSGLSYLVPLFLLMQFAFARDVVIMLPQYGSDELRLNDLEPPPRNLGKRRRSDEELPAPPAGSGFYT